MNIFFLSCSVIYFTVGFFILNRLNCFIVLLLFSFFGEKVGSISKGRINNLILISFFFFFAQIKWKQKYLQNTRTKIAVQALQTMQIRKYDVREATSLVENADGGMASCNHNNNESCVVCLEELLNGQVCVLFILFTFNFVYNIQHNV